MDAFPYIIICFVIAALVGNVWAMWRRGEITGVFPATPIERRRVWWSVGGAVNFVAFVAHVVAKGTCAFPTGGKLVGDVYLVPSHGKLIAFSPVAYALSFAHGVLFVLVTIACTVAIWRLHARHRAGSSEIGAL